MLETKVKYKQKRLPEDSLFWRINNFYERRHTTRNDESTLYLYPSSSSDRYETTWGHICRGLETKVRRNREVDETDDLCYSHSRSGARRALTALGRKSLCHCGLEISRKMFDGERLCSSIYIRIAIFYEDATHEKK